MRGTIRRSTSVIASRAGAGAGRRCGSRMTRVESRLRRACVLLGMAFALAACATPRPGQDAATHVPHAPAAIPAQVWITTSDHARALEPAPDAVATGDAPLPLHIRVDAARRYQRMVGFGASLTDASAWLIAHRMSPSQRSALLRELYGRQEGGVGFDFVRLTIGASDFSRRHYSLADTRDGAPDPALRSFSIDPNRRDVVPVLREVLAVNPGLKIMASPWSAPAWMKTSGSLVQGALKPEYHDAFARYLVRYVDAYAAEGIEVSALTLQNEPAYEPKDYPGMRLDAPARADIIGAHLGPMLAARARKVEIFDWDHNWDMPEQPLAVLADPRAQRYVDAVAWHCYGGEVSAQSRVRDAYPGKDVYHTECSGGDWEPVRSGGMTLQARTLIVGATRHWARGVLFWNLALDERGGPHAGGCDTCRGVVTVDSRTGRVSRTDDYYALAHASRFVRRDAYRIGSSEAAQGVDNVAFLNPDGTVALVVVNSSPASRAFSVSGAGARFDYALPGKSLATFVWQSGGRDAGP